MRIRTTILALLLSAAPASAGILAVVDNGSQTMQVYVDGAPTYFWRVSTARRGYVTPRGRYRVGRMERMWHSHKYHMSPMPYAMFFRGGYAIHGTGAVSQLGRPASHGCVRLDTANARTLFGLVSQYGGAGVVVN